ncbi:MAG: C-GCAxxG-C-C family (seleno)protein [Bacteroidales bacterium]
MTRDPALDATVLKYAKQYGNCAQTGFFSMRERFDLSCDESSYARALTAMPGIGGTCETCGGVSGPLMAFGLALVSAGPADKAQIEKCHAAAHRFCVAVQKAFGSTRCGDIIENCCGARYDLSNPEDARKYVEAGGLQKCVDVVQTTVHLAAGILEEVVGKGGAAQA